MFGWFKPKTNQFRIRLRIGGWEPQHSYTAGRRDGVFWFPLNAEGYWLEPEAFSDGNVTKHAVMPKALAERAVLRAKAINGVHIKRPKPMRPDPNFSVF